jgi:NTE family protein
LGGIEATSFYDTASLKNTLERLVDFDRINSGEIRFSVGAVNVRSGNFECFNASTHRIGPEPIMASGALPPGFPAIEIEGEFYWDGGLVSNTPLQWVLDSVPRRDTLAFQVDLWNARGELSRQSCRSGNAGAKKSTTRVAPGPARINSNIPSVCAIPSRPRLMTFPKA